MLSRLLGSSLALAGALACSVTNRDHCGNLDGDATCRERDLARPYCSLCVADNDGCVAAPVADAACRAESGAVTTAADSTAPLTSTSSSTTDPGSSSTTTTTGGGGSSGPDVAMCGDGVAEGMENCDGDDFRGKGCDDFPGYGGGTLLCEDCKYNYADCCLLIGLTCKEDADCCPGTTCELDVLMAKMTCQ